MVQTLAAIRRYPVKAMVGEDLVEVDLDERGLRGDRLFAVADGEGRFASHKDTRRFRRRDGIERFAASTTSDGEVEVSHEGRTFRVGDPALDRALATALGTAATVVREAEVPHQDADAVSLVGTASLRQCAEAWGVDADPRRLRVNLLVETEEPFVEEGWVGQEVQVGRSRLLVRERVERCRTVDLAQDGLETGSRWLKRLGRERDLRLAVYADVTAPGPLAVGNTVVVS